MGTFGEFAQAVDGHHAAHHLHAQELIRCVQGERSQQHRNHVSHKRRARIEEHTNEDGHHGKRHQINAEEAVGHHERRYHRKERHQRKEEQRAARRVHIIATEQAQIEQEEHQCHHHINHLSAQDGPHCLLRVAAAFALKCQRLQYLVLCFVHDFSLVDNSLSALHHAASLGGSRHEVVASGVGLCRVYQEVGAEIIVQVALHQHFPREAHRVGQHDVLVSRACGEYLTQIAWRRLTSFQHPDAGSTHRREGGKIRGTENTGAIDFRELPLQV